MVNSPQIKQRNGSTSAATNVTGGDSNADGRTAGTQWKEIFQKSLRARGDWPEKDDLLDVVYWGRQILGALVGITWGLVAINGILGLLIYLALTTALVHLYVTVYQKQDEERFGGLWELAKEGFGSSFATFLVCWILVYTAIYFESSS